MGSNHARVLAGLPDVTLIGIVDPLPEHRARATAMVGCRAFASLDELFDEDVDAITIAAPTICITRSRSPASPQHPHPGREAGRSTVEEGQDIVNAARSAGVTLMVGHVERFNRRSPRSSRRSRARIFFRSASPASGRFRRGCPMSAS